MNDIKRIIGAIFLFGLLTQSSYATHGGWCACGKPITVPVHFQIIGLNMAYQNETIKALERWNTYADIFTWSIGNDITYSDNGINEIFPMDTHQIEQSYGFFLSRRAIVLGPIGDKSADPPFSVCPIPSGTTCGDITERDIIINASYPEGFRLCTPEYDKEFNSAWCFRTLILHELGHTLGFKHNFENLSAMNYLEDYAQQYLTLSDANALRGHYSNHARIDLNDVATYPFCFHCTRSGHTVKGSYTTIVSVSPTLAMPGSQVTISHFTVENMGTTTLNNVELKLYLSSDKTITPEDYLLGRLSWESFSTWWDDDGRGRTFQVPNDIPDGKYYIGAIVTYDNGAEDAITYNNSWVLNKYRQLIISSWIGDVNQLPHHDRDVNIFTLPRVTVDSLTAFNNVELLLKSNSWEVINAELAADPNFNPMTGIISFPRFTVDSSTVYDNVQLKLNPNGHWNILTADTLINNELTAVADYDTSTNVLSTPRITIDTSNVFDHIEISLSPDGTWKLLNAEMVFSSNYDTSTHILSIPIATFDSSEPFQNLQLLLNPNGSWGDFVEEVEADYNITSD